MSQNVGEVDEQLTGSSKQRMKAGLFSKCQESLLLYLD